MKLNSIVKFISIVILLNILLTNIGSHLLFKVLEKKIKYDIKAHILDVDIKIDFIELNLEYDEFLDLNWENSHEFILRNKIYDVKSIKFKLDKIIIKCYLDQKETDLRSNYFQYLNKYLDQKEKSNNILFNILDLLLNKYIFTNSTILNIIFYDHFLRFIDFENVLSRFLEVRTPPPNN